MTWVYAVLGFIGVGGVVTLAAFLIHIGKKLKEAEYDKAGIAFRDDHIESIKRWAKENDRLADESNRLKARLRADPSLPNVLRVLSEAHGPDDLPSSDGPDST